MPLVLCSDCGSQVSDAAAACVHCGSPIGASPTKRVCPQCKGTTPSASCVPGGPVWCNGCGEEMQLVERMQPAQPQAIRVPEIVVVNGSRKSVFLAIALAFFFGPLGMLYSTVKGAVVCFLIIVCTLGYGTIIAWPLGLFWAARAASAHNEVKVVSR